MNTLVKISAALFLCSAGHLTLTIGHGVYRVEMRQENSSFKAEVDGSERVWICVLAQEKSLCMNISRSFIQHRQNGLHAQLTHSFSWLLSAGTLTSIIVDILNSGVNHEAWSSFLSLWYTG